MIRPRKYGPGEPIASLDELLELARTAWSEVRDEFVWRDFGDGTGKPVHVLYAVNQSAWLLANMIPQGMLRRAAISAEYAEWLKRESARVAETGPALAACRGRYIRLDVPPGQPSDAPALGV